jgi:hypothetical protein
MQIKVVGIVFSNYNSIKFVMHSKIINMKRILILAFLAFVLPTISKAQQNDNININAETLNSVLTGKWILVSALPDNSVANFTSFTVQGPGYGLVDKNMDGKIKSVVCKIVANNSGIVFNDAEGDRMVFKVTYLSKKSITLQSGKTTLMFNKQ